jgi:glycosyltransferase involved in cell wall biosynthesis
MAPPLFSVLIDTYNHERYIEQAITSVLEQDFPPSDMEILVVDDGSSDSTPAVIQKFIPRIRYIRKTNGGQASAFNFVIPEAKGEILAFLDGDDWWAKGKLVAVAEAFERNRLVAAVGHGFYNVDESGMPIDIFAPEKTCQLDLSSIEAARVADFGRTLLGTSRLSVRRRILERIGPLPLELTFCADTPILTLSLALGGAIIIETPLCYYRQHSANLFAPHLRADSSDENHLSRKYEVLAFLLAYLPQRLAEIGVPKSNADALFESDRIELKRFHLQRDGGRWANFRTELRGFRWQSKNWSPGYLIFKAAVGVLALVLPPSRLGDVRNWYAKRDLRRFREVLGTAEPAVPASMFKRIPIARGD